MKRPVHPGFASLKALSVMIALGAVAHAGLPYLPLIGPPPLRVQAAKSPVVPIAPLEVKPAVSVAESNMPPVTAVSSPGTTNVTPSEVAVAPAPETMPTPEESLGSTISSSVFTLPTPDLIGITPQMLATYFHPVQFGTNAVLTGPFRINFLPPLPPANSSHAEYILK